MRLPPAEADLSHMRAHPLGSRGRTERVAPFAYRHSMGRLLGALVGAGFFLWIAGVRIIDPGEIGWLRHFDWPVHFLGWHFFRSEPWRLPPGLIAGFHTPMGTSIGFTDSVPLVAFALKPFSGWLPATFQYIGGWLLLCFTLQGLLGAWITSRWSPRVSVQVLGAALFVLMPTLLIRIGHPALCAHWVLLWTLLVATRGVESRFRPGEWLGLGLTGGLLHPYLAVMSLGLLTGTALTPQTVALRVRGGTLALAAGGTLTGWWAAGLFSVSDAASMATVGLGDFSMNLLAPVSPHGWSAFLPEIARATQGQDFEGFQYLGLGTLLLLAVAVGVRLTAVAVRPWADTAPVLSVGLAVTALLMAIFALSPRVTAGATVLVDGSGPWTSAFAVFRATGRFFWPLAYVMLVWILASLGRRLPSRVLISVLCTAVILQALDLHGAHEERRRVARDPEFYEWPHAMTAAVWHQVLPRYDHLVLYPPPQCGPAPVAYEPAAYLAGLHGLDINAGGVARPDLAAQRSYCHDLGEQMKAGDIDARSFYIVPAAEVPALRAAAGGHLRCGPLDGVTVCVEARSYEAWRDLAVLP